MFTQYLTPKLPKAPDERRKCPICSKPVPYAGHMMCHSCRAKD